MAATVVTRNGMRFTSGMEITFTALQNPICQHCGNRMAEYLSVNYVDGYREECLCCDECVCHMSEFATITRLQVGTPVNDSETLTHEEIIQAIYEDESGEKLHKLADEAEKAHATSLAAQLRGFATDRSNRS